MRSPAKTTLRVAAKIEPVWESTRGPVTVAPPPPIVTPITGSFFVSGPTDHTRAGVDTFWAKATPASASNSTLADRCIVI